jgi:TRAP-type mannitol/chloroaromatic compound transport system permease small subunit
VTNTDHEVAARYGIAVDEEAEGIAEPWNTDGGNVGWIASISEWTGRVVAWLVLPLMAILAFEAIRRFLFGQSTAWAQDVAYMIYATHFLIGAAYTLKHSGHIRTDFAYRNWKTKRQALVDAVIYGVVFIPVMVIAVKVSAEFAWDSFRIREKVIQSPWRGPVWPLKAMLPLGLALWTLQSVSEFIKSVRAYRSGEWEPARD